MKDTKYRDKSFFLSRRTHPYESGRLQGLDETERNIQALDPTDEQTQSWYTLPLPPNRQLSRIDASRLFIVFRPEAQCTIPRFTQEQAKR